MSTLEDGMRVALEGGIWPARVLRELLAVAFSCNGRTVQRAAQTLHERGELRVVRQAYWLAPAMTTDETSLMSEEPEIVWAHGFPREQLIRHLVRRQEPSATTSDCSREAYLDGVRELMGAESVYEP